MDALLLELGFELFLIDLLEDVLEAAVIGLEDGVLGRKVDRPAQVQPVVERGAGEIGDAVIQVVHAHEHARRRGGIDIAFNRGAVIAHEFHRQLARARKTEVGGAVLVTKGMAAHDDGLGPARHKARHVAADDRLAKDDAAQNVADRAVRAFPHLFQAEFLDPLFIRGDGRAFHAHAVLLDRIGGIDGDLIVGAVALFDPQIVIFQIKVEVGQDQLFLDEVPDDPGHLVAIKFDDGVGYLDLRHARLIGLGFGLRRS